MHTRTAATLLVLGTDPHQHRPLRAEGQTIVSSSAVTSYSAPYRRVHRRSAHTLGELIRPRDRHRNHTDRGHPEDGAWCARAQVHPGVVAYGDGDNEQAAVDYLCEGPLRLL
jgi:hypothetical protein